MTVAIAVISSMATQHLLAGLLPSYRQSASQPPSLLSTGGVEAARRVRAGAPFDVVVLASDVIDELIGAGHVLAGSRTDLVRSSVALAVRRGASRPAVGSETELRKALLSAGTVGYSTGPSGVALQRLFARWGIADTLRERLVQAPPGVPVGALIARGEVELGFQQLSELIHVDGIDVLGEMPPELAIVTTFSAGVCAASSQPDAARALLRFLASPAADEAKRQQGMQPA